MKVIIYFLLTISSLYANSGCNDDMFSFDITQSNSKVKIVDIVENLAHECMFSVKIKDKESLKLLKKNFYLVHIKNYTLDNMFDFLFTQNNMFYEYNKNKKLLTISYIQTHSFVIDYVNLSEHTTESVKTITVGASSGTQNSSGTSSNSSTTSSSGGSSGSSSQNSSGSNGNSDNTTVTTKSEFQFWDKLAQEIDDILSRDNDLKISSKSIINREAGVITITGTQNQIKRISEYLTKIKLRLHKQVMLETKLLELTYAKSDSIGVDWSKFDLSLKGNLGKSWGDGATTQTSLSYDFSMDGLVDFLNKYGKINVLSTPKILTLNNQPAVINIGEQFNYRYQSGSLSTANATTSATNTYMMNSVFVGLTLNIVPEITDNGFVILKVNPVVSEKIDTDTTLASDGGDVFDEQGVRIMPPDIRIKQLSSIVKAKDGDRVIVGGLISTINKTTDNSIPLLGDIPGVGWLFKNKSKSKYKTELIIVITPKIIKDNSFPSIDTVEKQLNNSPSIENIENQLKELDNE